MDRSALNTFSEAKEQSLLEPQNAKHCLFGSHFVGSYLKNHNLAIISLQVEGPGGGDEALGGADNVVAPTGHGLHHRGGLRAERHGLELRKREQENIDSLCMCFSICTHLCSQ